MNAENMYDAWDNGDRHEIRQQLAKRNKKDMTDRELMQQALEALDWHLERGAWGADIEGVAAALRERLAQPEQWQGLAADSTIQTVPAQGGLLPAQFGIRGGLAQDTQNKEQNR